MSENPAEAFLECCFEDSSGVHICFMCSRDEKMIITTEGIVLRQRKIAGNRRMIVIFTRQYGKISAGTSINEKSRNKAALALRPFTFAEYDLFRGREAYSINSASVRRSYYSIGEDIDRFMTASAFIEFLDKVTADEEPLPGLYDLAIEFLESVSRTTGSSETLLFAFIVRSLRLLGVSPEMNCCVSCGKQQSDLTYGKGVNGKDKMPQFSVTAGGIICDECAEIEKREGNALIYRPSFDIIDVFRYFQSKPLSTFEKVTLKGSAEGMIKKILAEYTERYLGVDVLSNIGELEA